MPLYTPLKMWLDYQKQVIFEHHFHWKMIVNRCIMILGCVFCMYKIQISYHTFDYGYSFSRGISIHIVKYIAVL